MVYNTKIGNVHKKERSKDMDSVPDGKNNVSKIKYPALLQDFER